ncbi:MAG: DUF5671 domain-containing protein [Anaerolineales bacterium]|nr:DUF5671 domain-containing protein [Anaerolineales bacterium]
MQNLLALIDRAFLSAANLYVSRAVIGGAQTWIDNLIAIVINLLIAAYFWNVTQSAWRALPEQENFAEIRRLYRFIWMLYGLIMIIFGAQQALSYAFALSSTDVLGAMGREVVVNAIALLIIGAPIWYYSWRVSQNALSDSDEQESLLRLALLYKLSLIGVVVTLTASGNLLYLILMRAFGDGKTLAEFIQSIGAPISIGVPFAVVWAYYGDWLRLQFAFDENSIRRAGKRRLYFYILSLIGLAASFFAVASLLSLVIDLLTSKSYLSSGGFSEPLSRALAFLAAGLPLWLLTWRPTQFRALEDGALGDHARRSVIRKIYLYLVLFAAVIGGMASAGGLIFTLINAALGGETSNFANSILNNLQALILFIVLLFYHLSALRTDGALRADALEAKQKGFSLTVFDHDGKFGERMKVAFAKRAPNLTLNIVSVKDEIPAELKADAILFSSILLTDAPKNIEAWIRSFNGNKLAVAEDAAGVFWAGNDPQAVDSARALAEGEQIRPQSAKGTSTWTYIAYVFAALFALQVLFMLITLGVSLVTGF